MEVIVRMVNKGGGLYMSQYDLPNQRWKWFYGLVLYAWYQA